MFQTFSSSLTETKEMNGDVGRKRDETLQEGGIAQITKLQRELAYIGVSNVYNINQARNIPIKLATTVLASFNYSSPVFCGSP